MTDEPSTAPNPNAPNPTTPNPTTPNPSTPLAGSFRAQPAGTRPGAPLPADEQVEFTLLLRRRAGLDPDLVQGAGTVDRAAFADRFGADPTDVDTVGRVLAEHGLQVLSADPASRRIRGSGPASAVSATFGTELRTATTPDPVGSGQVTHRHRSGELSVPTELADVVVAVLGLDTRPQARAQFRTVPAAAVSQSFTPVQLGELYDFPTGADGAGRTVAIIELGGGFDRSDLDSYFGGLGLATPTVAAVCVDGAANAPGGDPNGADGEVLLDIEVVGALAPGASIVVYFAPNTDAGFLDAVSQAAHADPTPAAISISWGGPEDSWTAQARTAMDEAFQDAAALGVTVTAAAGDGGSADGQDDGQPHADFPAASPHALACGGTAVRADGGRISAETVWNSGSGGGATGGGVSETFGLPDWQASAGVPANAQTGKTGRGVPDVAGDADPATGYQVLVDGTRTVIGGTSAVAPLWAALVARFCQSLDRGLGLLQPALYAPAAAGSAVPGFRDITSGGNGDYSAGPGWDPCTGLGSPDGTALLERLGSAG